MRAALHVAPGQVRVGEVPDPRVEEPTDAVVRVLRSCVCGSDLWGYRGITQRAEGARLGHEFLGVVEDVGAEVTGLRRGDLVVAPFSVGDGTCPYCQEGLWTSCPHVGYWAGPGLDGGQGEAVRVPWAAANLVAVPGGLEAVGEELLPALLSCSDVTATGLHGNRMADVQEGSTVVVVGDGAVGLCAVLTAKQVLGAERVVLLSRHPARQEVGRRFGATDVLAERGDAAVEAVRELTGGLGARSVVEAVGTPEAWETALGVCRDGGSIGAVGVPHTTPTLGLRPVFSRNLTVRAGVCPSRRYLPELVTAVVEGRLDPSPVFDLELPLDRVGDAYAAMDGRTAIKTVLVP